MNGQTVEIGVLAAYVEVETERWREWFAAAPEGVLALGLGAHSDDTIRVLVKHIFAVELRYAQRLAGEPVSEYADLADGSVGELWAIHLRAADLRDTYLAGATAEELDRTLTFQTRRLGPGTARAHTVVVHTLIHSIRHWAQIATVLRQHGHAGLWEHDWLMSPAAR